MQAPQSSSERSVRRRNAAPQEKMKASAPVLVNAEEKVRSVLFPWCSILTSADTLNKSTIISSTLIKVVFWELLVRYLQTCPGVIFLALIPVFSRGQQKKQR